MSEGQQAQKIYSNKQQFNEFNVKIS